MELGALCDEVATATAETACIEFKSRFDPSSRQDWCKLIKHLLALANSGGGCVVFGLNSDGSDAGVHPIGFEGVDPATVTNGVSAFLSRPFQAFRLVRFERSGHSYPGIVVEGASIPFVPHTNGNYSIGRNDCQSAFHEGELYFRHGAKSEIATQSDLDSLCQRAATAAREQCFREIELLKSVGPGQVIQIVPEGSPGSLVVPVSNIRLSDDASAPGCVSVDRFKTHPHRGKELIQRLVTRLPGFPFNQYDILCVRRVHRLEIESKGFLYHPPHGSIHFSDGLVDWIAGNVQADPEFLRRTRSAFRRGDAMPAAGSGALVSSIQ